jgi:hypothetical protein
VTIFCQSILVKSCWIGIGERMALLLGARGVFKRPKAGFPLIAREKGLPSALSVLPFSRFKKEL